MTSALTHHEPVTAQPEPTTEEIQIAMQAVEEARVVLAHRVTYLADLLDRLRGNVVEERAARLPDPAPQLTE